MTTPFLDDDKGRNGYRKGEKRGGGGGKNKHSLSHLLIKELNFVLTAIHAPGWEGKESHDGVEVLKE
jgi:hypothetical protein